MRRLLPILLLCLLASCKKDLLHYHAVQQIASHADTDRLNKVLMLDGQHGIIAGGKWYTEAVILTTADGGDTWQRQTFYDVGHLLNSATVAPDGTIYCTGFEGKLMFSADTGKTWTFRQMEHYYFRDLSFRNNSEAVLVGGISFGSGMRLRIGREGEPMQRDSFTYQLNQVRMADQQTGYICGFGIFLKTTDGGQHWTIKDVNGDNFIAMDVKGNDVWLCGTNGSIFHSADAGEHWGRLRNGNDITARRYRLWDIKFADNTHGWAVGENGVVLYSDDGGHHWMEFDQFTTNNLLSIALLPEGRVLVTGDNGAIFKLTP